MEAYTPPASLWLHGAVPAIEVRRTGTLVCPDRTPRLRPRAIIQTVASVPEPVRVVAPRVAGLVGEAQEVAAAGLPAAP